MSQEIHKNGMTVARDAAVAFGKPEEALSSYRGYVPYAVYRVPFDKMNGGYDFGWFKREVLAQAEGLIQRGLDSLEGIKFKVQVAPLTNNKDIFAEIFVGPVLPDELSTVNKMSAGQLKDFLAEFAPAIEHSITQTCENSSQKNTR